MKKSTDSLVNENKGCDRKGGIEQPLRIIKEKYGPQYNSKIVHN